MSLELHFPITSSNDVFYAGCFRLVPTSGPRHHGVSGCSLVSMGLLLDSRALEMKPRSM